MRKLFTRPLPRPDLWLVGVLLLALALRVWGLTWGLPSATHYFSYHPDESVVLETATGMNVLAGHLLPHFYHYGSLQIYLVCFANTLAALFRAVDSVPKEFAVWYPQWAKMYLIGRFLTVGMGVGTVWAVYAIGRRLWGRRAGVLAALTLAIMPLHAQHSHFLTVDVPAAFWAALSLLWAVRLATGDLKPARAALWAGAFAGLAAATKYNLALMILPLAVGCLLTRQWKLTGLGLAAFALAFLLACPGAILESRTFLNDLRFEAIHVQNADDPTFRDTGNGFVYHITRNLAAGLGLPLLLLSLVSVGYTLYRRERGDGLLAAFALPYYVLIGLAAIRYARYDIPLLPILALWNGRLLAEGSRLPRRAFRWPAIAGSSVILLLTLVNALWLINPMTLRDPRDIALDIIQGPRVINLKGDIGSPHPRVIYAVQPWFGTPPVSPYFSMPRPGAWRDATSPEILKRIVYPGKDWDVSVLRSKISNVVVLSEYDYDDPLRIKYPAAIRYFQALEAYHYGNYDVEFERRYSINPLALLDGLPTSVGGMPTRGLPHDMLYTNPYIFFLYRLP